MQALQSRGQGGTQRLARGKPAATEGIPLGVSLERRGHWSERRDLSSGFQFVEFGLVLPDLLCTDVRYLDHRIRSWSLTYRKASPSSLFRRIQSDALVLW